MLLAQYWLSMQEMQGISRYGSSGSVKKLRRHHIMQSERARIVTHELDSIFHYVMNYYSTTSGGLPIQGITKSLVKSKPAPSRKASIGDSS